MLDAHELDGFEPVAKIKVIGVGGAGNNAVNRMIVDDIKNVEFFVVNTDKQALALSKAPNRLVLGESITGGLGAGGEPSVGKAAAEASEEDIREIVRGANMVFIAAGMGGGTGTGAAPIISKIAKEEGALTVAIVTRPFFFEGNRKIQASIQGLNALKECCDSLIVVSNDKLLVNNGSLPIAEAYALADGVLAQSVKTVTNLILMPSYINLDFADVRATLKDSGVAFIGFGDGVGPNAAYDAAIKALTCPLIEQSIEGARKAICHLTVGPKVSLFDQQTCIYQLIYRGNTNETNTLDLKFGISINEELEDMVMVSLIAGDFDSEYDFSINPGTQLDFQKLSREHELQRKMLFEKQVEQEQAIIDAKNKEENKETVKEESIIPEFLNDSDF